MSRGGGEKVDKEYSELTQLAIENAVLKKDLTIYKSFANQVQDLIRHKDDMNFLKEEVGVGGLVYLLNLIRVNIK